MTVNQFETNSSGAVQLVGDEVVLTLSTPRGKIIESRVNADQFRQALSDGIDTTCIPRAYQPEVHRDDSGTAQAVYLDENGAPRLVTTEAFDSDTEAWSFVYAVVALLEDPDVRFGQRPAEPVHETQGVAEVGEE